MLGSAVLGSYYLASATAQTPGLPPPLPVGAKAILWARSAIGRSNATRSNYIGPHITVLLTQYRYPNPPVTVDLSMWTRDGSLQVTQAINDEPDSCSLTLKPETPAAYYPLVGDVIAVGLASESTVPDHSQKRIAAGAEFAGPVVVLQHDRRPKNESPWIAVSCQDWQWFFDAQLVNARWPAQSATLTLQDLLARFVNASQITPAGTLRTFSMATYVPANLPTCEAFDAINWRPTEVIRHLANEMQGGFYIDPNRDVHVWANGAEPNQSNPQPLQNYLQSLKSFRHRIDAGQLRRRVVTEGMGTRTLIDVPTLAEVPYLGGIPVADARPFLFGEHSARLGTQWVRVEVTHALQPVVEQPFAAHVTTAFAVTDGALIVDAYPYYIAVGGGGWIKVGEQFLRYDLSTFTGSAWNLRVNQGYFPFGRAITPIKVGETVTWLDWIDVWKKDAHAAVSGFEPIRDAPAGTELVVLAEAVDGDAGQPFAAHLPPIEALVQDGRYGYTGAATRATDDVSFFRLPLTVAEWVTDDYNARPGRPQVILLTDVDPVSASLTIQSVTVSFPLRSLAPRRACSAAAVKPSTLLDVLTTSTT